MRERPILMSAPMVRALLAGAKTQTRRAVKPQPQTAAGVNCTRLRFLDRRGAVVLDEALDAPLPHTRNVLCPYGQPGDRLWVRESLGYCSEYGHYYATDRTFLCSVFDDEAKQTGYSYECDMREASVPSIHLPRRWSRITLEVTGVRVDRLQNISRGDAMAEGCPFPNMAHGADPRAWFADLWQEINGAGSWGANPWVWVIEFQTRRGTA
jgi:hypothetical protein